MFEQINMVMNEIDDLLDLVVHNDDDYSDEIIDIKIVVKELKNKIANDLKNGVESREDQEYA